MLPLTVMSYPTDIELSISPVDAYYDTNSNNIEDVKRTKRAGSFNFIGAISNVSYEDMNHIIAKYYFNVTCLCYEKYQYLDQNIESDFCC